MVQVFYCPPASEVKSVEPAPVPHADYPHHPGTLPGCYVCDTVCFCKEYDGDYTCVHCDSEDDSFF